MDLTGFCSKEAFWLKNWCVGSNVRDDGIQRLQFRSPTPSLAFCGCWYQLYANSHRKRPQVLKWWYPEGDRAISSSGFLLCLRTLPRRPQKTSPLNSAYMPTRASGMDLHIVSQGLSCPWGTVDCLGERYCSKQLTRSNEGWSQGPSVTPCQPLVRLWLFVIPLFFFCKLPVYCFSI